MRIEVHAEGIGKAETQKRAEVVRDFLVAKGVDGARLTPVGEGAGPSRVGFMHRQHARRHPAGGARNGRAAGSAGRSHAASRRAAGRSHAASRSRAAGRGHAAGRSHAAGRHPPPSAAPPPPGVK